MKKYHIFEINDKELTLRDEEGKEYKTEIFFHDLEEEPKAGDTITMYEGLVDTNNSDYFPFYEFGGMDSIYGRKIDSDTHHDLMILDLGGKEIRLKRFYG